MREYMVSEASEEIRSMKITVSIFQIIIRKSGGNVCKQVRMSTMNWMVCSVKYDLKWGD